MYYEHYGLQAPPFRITPDTSLFYPGGNRGAILDAMVYAISSGEGITKVVGEVGSGKTMLCRMLEVRLPNNVEVVYLANPSLAPEDILHAIAFEMKLPVDKSDNRLQVMQALQEHLVRKHAQNRQVVVFVEEAQSMPLGTLEEIRLLSNLETQQYKLLQIVMFGQPELEQNLSRPSIRQLRERITHSFTLDPFSRNEIGEYVNYRMHAAGYRGPDVFSARALKLIERYSKGLTRRVNILADKALLAAFANGEHRVTDRHVRIAAADSDFGMLGVSNSHGWYTAAAGLAIVALGIGFWVFHGGAAALTGQLRSALAGGQEPVQGGAPASDRDVEPLPGPAAAELIAAAAPVAPARPAVAEMARPPAAIPAPELLERIVALKPAAGAPAGTANRPLPGPVPAPDTAPQQVAAQTTVAVQPGLTPPVDPAPIATLSPAPADTVERPVELAPARPAQVAGTAPALPVGAPAAATVAARSQQSDRYLRERLAETDRWLREANGNHYSIQLMMIRRDRGDLLGLNLVAAGIEHSLDRVYVYETQVNGSDVLSVLLDEFSSREDAKLALASLPAAARAGGPFVRNIRDIRVAQR